jgi:hypothetical protein
MSKRYINTRSSLSQDKVDDWLLMIPAAKVSSDAKIVYLALKKMQYSDGSCSTDSNTWLNITGVPHERVKECLLELEAFGLVELYMSPRELRKPKNKIYSIYLLDHFLMKKMYGIMECPHDGISVPNPLDESHFMKKTRVTRYIDDCRNAAKRDIDCTKKTPIC